MAAAAVTQTMDLDRQRQKGGFFFLLPLFPPLFSPLGFLQGRLYISSESSRRILVLDIEPRTSTLTPRPFPLSSPVTLASRCPGPGPSLRYIPEDTRAAVMNIFRIPLNAFVVLVLIKVKFMPIEVVFGICTAAHLFALFAYMKFRTHV